MTRDGDHRQSEPSERQWNLECKAAQYQRAGKSNDIGAKPRPGRADRAVMADQHIGEDHVGGDDRAVLIR
jgi:hypothetical protein